MNVSIQPLTGWLDFRVWVVLLAVLCIAQSWVLLGKAWRRNPPGFIWRTFLDERGVPDGKLLAVCHALGIMTFETVLSAFTGNWPPYYVWVTWDVIAIAGIFGSAYVSKKYFEAKGSTAQLPLPGEPGCEPAMPPAAAPDDTL